MDIVEIFGPVVAGSDVRTITNRLSNPFDMRPPCRRTCAEGVPAVFGYGDANADFHLIGDHPGEHGGRQTGLPFTETAGARRLRRVLASLGLVDEATGDPRNLFMSYLHMCCPPDGEDPSEEAYLDLERFFDAELRAIAAHVLLPVGERAINHVLGEFSAVSPDVIDEPSALHATELAGSGFLIVPLRHPDDWQPADEVNVASTLRELLDSDYRQTADLTRFSPSDDPYLVR